jgi:hypothetical protein
MEYVVGLVVLVLGGLLYSSNRKNQRLAVDNKLSEVKGKDSVLSKESLKVKNEIDKIDHRLEELKLEREAELERERLDSMSLAERAKEARKRFGK